MDEAEQLSAEEVAALPADTSIVVIWSGGNGPHRYRVYVDERGNRYAYTGSGSPTYNRLEFVGREHFHTRVWLDPSSRGDRG